MIGVDAGGTTTRCVLVDTTGARRGEGRARGINQRSSGVGAVEPLASAIRQALGDHPPTDVRAAVLAIAGAGEAGRAQAESDGTEVWRDLGLGGRPIVVPDVLATFSAGSAEPAGEVIVAGTGAIAASVAAHELVRRADGYGWLLGDVGSAVWIGREAVAVVLAAIDGRARPTSLTEPVLEALLGDAVAVDAQPVVAKVYGDAPAALGRLAPLVTDQARAGDATAVQIVERAVRGLLTSFDAVRRTGTPVVLGGALLTSPGPVLDGVRDGLEARGHTDVRTVAQATAGAAWLALRRLGVPGDPELHARLCGPYLLGG